MPPCAEKAHLKKTLSTCAIVSLVLLVGLLLFFILFVTLRWRNITEEDPDQDWNDSINEDCTSKAAVLTDTEEILQKWKLNESFAEAWSEAEGKARAPAHIYMERDHSEVIYFYTSVLSSGRRGERLKDVFKSRSFYSLLSEALQVLRHSQVTCFSTTYRSNTLFGPNVSHTLVRFHTFTLGSDWWSSSGNTSCFEVFTCFGANVTLYSALTQSSQVLIPPYEVFDVTDVQTDAQSCKVVYKLKSNMNCVYDRESNTLHPTSAFSGGGFWVIFIITCVLIVLFLLMFVVVKVIQNSKRQIYHSAKSSDTSSPGWGQV